VKAIKYGAENFLTKPVAMDDLKVILERCIELGSVRKRDLIRQRLVNQDSPYFGKSESTARVLEQAKNSRGGRHGRSSAGRNGHGKRVLARWIHNNGERRSEAFIEVNCSMLKGELLRSELFGHARGASPPRSRPRKGSSNWPTAGRCSLTK